MKIPPRHAVALAVILAAGFAAAGCGGNDKATREYPAGDVATFTANCVAYGVQNGLAADEAARRCSCAMRKIQEQVPYEDFVAALTAAEFTRALNNPKIARAVESCR